jgi:DNA-binding NarL/FixJ family response regulator
MRKRVLLVEPASEMRAELRESIEEVADVQAYACFEHARGLLASPFDFVVSNLRLGPYNGLHLVYRTLGASVPPRCIVYTAERDQGLAREVQRAGAFYETADCLPVTLAAYLSGHLPARDRRDSAALDRRTTFRGGRRCWDRQLLLARASQTTS